MSNLLTGLIGTALIAISSGGMAYSNLKTSENTGVSVNTESSDLRIIDAHDELTDWKTGFDLSSVYPGFLNYMTMYIKNKSQVSISPYLQLTAATFWPNLQFAVEVNITSSDEKLETGWRSLAEWNRAPLNLPGNSISPNGTNAYVIFVRVPTIYGDGPNNGSPIGNDISNEGLGDVTFTLTGKPVN